MENQFNNMNEDKLDKILEMQEKNNKILKQIHSNQRVNMAFKFIYWILIIVAVFGSYYLLKPTINDTFSDFETIRSALNTISEDTEKIPDASRIKEILKNINY